MLHHTTVLSRPSRATGRLLAASMAVSVLGPAAALPATAGAGASPDAIVQRSTGVVATASPAATTGGDGGGLSTGAVLAIVGGGLVVVGAAGTAVRYRLRTPGGRTAA